MLTDEREDTSQNSNQRVRGQVSLRGAVVSPSDEDSRTFTVNCVSGDILKLRAADARERQEWVDGLRAIVESHAQPMPLPPKENLAAYNALINVRHQLQQTELCNSELSKMIENSPPPLNYNDPDLLLLKVSFLFDKYSIRFLIQSMKYFLKALSAANTNTLMQCLSYLQRHQEVVDFYS